MKIKAFLMLAILLAIIAFSSTLDAQTRQKELIANFPDMYIPCVDRTIGGTWIAHFTYFLGKDGTIERIHVNTWASEIHDIQTGEKVKCLDTFNDSYGYYFWYMNNPNAANGIDNLYNVEDGWLDEYMPEVYPFEEGTLVEMNWKFIFKGKKWGISSLMQIHLNAQGEPTVTIEKSKAICSE